MHRAVGHHSEVDDGIEEYLAIIGDRRYDVVRQLLPAAVLESKGLVEQVAHVQGQDAESIGQSIADTQIQHAEP